MKGNLHCCDNWREISLLDVVGKLLSRIVSQKLAKKVLPESQSGIRKGHSCTAMILMVSYRRLAMYRQLAENRLNIRDCSTLIICRSS